MRKKLVAKKKYTKYLSNMLRKNAAKMFDPSIMLTRRRSHIGPLKVVGAVAVLVLGVTVLALIPGLTPPAGLDKVVHFVAFAALILPIVIFCPRMVWVAFTALLIFGIAVEYLQSFVGRTPSLSDAVANLLGLAFGLTAGTALRMMAFRSEKNLSAKKEGADA